MEKTSSKRTKKLEDPRVAAYRELWPTLRRVRFLKDGSVDIFLRTPNKYGMTIVHANEKFLTQPLQEPSLAPKVKTKKGRHAR